MSIGLQLIRLSRLFSASNAGGVVGVDTSGNPSVGQGFPTGTIIEYSGTSAPTGYLACPLVATNVSRTGTYANLFAAIGTTWGVGDGSTTFGIPYFPADQVAVQANSNVGTATTGALIAHTHDYETFLGGSTLNSGANGNPGTFTAGLVTTGQSPTGNANNLPAGVRILKCVKL